MHAEMLELLEAHLSPGAKVADVGSGMFFPLIGHCHENAQALHLFLFLAPLPPSRILNNQALQMFLDAVTLLHGQRVLYRSTCIRLALGKEGDINTIHALSGQHLASPLEP